MKKFQLPLFLCGILGLLGFGCEEGGKPTNCELAACDPGRKTVKQWIDREGMVLLDNSNQMYYISTGESPDIHILGYSCNLPEEFRTEGMLVAVSGELKDDCDELNLISVAQENYYLHIDNIEPLKD
ncbi:MAG TPA: hypothetical protein VKZ51_08555 [Cyclobacteriaceae bacterium]|nr:hypothetical protein [Cyclobacteriaceae bacterium]